MPKTTNIFAHKYAPILFPSIWPYVWSLQINTTWKFIWKVYLLNECNGKVSFESITYGQSFILLLKNEIVIDNTLNIWGQRSKSKVLFIHSIIIMGSSTTTYRNVRNIHVIRKIEQWFEGAHKRNNIQHTKIGE